MKLSTTIVAWARTQDWFEPSEIGKSASLDELTSKINTELDDIVKSLIRTLFFQTKMEEQRVEKERIMQPVKEMTDWMLNNVTMEPNGRFMYSGIDFPMSELYEIYTTHK